MTMRERMPALALLLAAFAAHSAFAYNGATHQQLTFIAARHYNHCADQAQRARLTPLQVRYAALANAGQAEAAWWRRLFRWNYYDSDEHSAGRMLGLFETRMHGRFRDAERQLAQAQDLGRRFTSFGRIVGHIQDATSPSTVAPVFAMRWWRFSFADRFAAFPVDAEALQRDLGGDCTALRGADGTLETLLQATAQRTLASLETRIGGLPSTWRAFWTPGENGRFGRYGDAGNNFGRSASFRCTEDSERQCVLLDDDPLYARYAHARHLDAVRATIAAIALMRTAQPDAAPVE